MSELELNHILARVKEPTPSTEAQDHALKSALAAFDQKMQKATPCVPFFSSRKFFVQQSNLKAGLMYLALSCILLSFPYLTQGMQGSINGGSGSVNLVEGQFVPPQFNGGGETQVLAAPPAIVNPQTSRQRRVQAVDKPEPQTANQGRPQGFETVSANIVESSWGLPSMISTAVYLLTWCMGIFAIKHFYKSRKQTKDKNSRLRNSLLYLIPEVIGAASVIIIFSAVLSFLLVSTDSGRVLIAFINPFISADSLTFTQVFYFISLCMLISWTGYSYIKKK